MEHRITKFKVWHQKEKRWMVDCVISDDGTISRVDEENHCFQLFDDYKDLIAVFWTGLTDKNGKEIYEGDIVKIHPEPEKSPSMVAEGMIKWINSGFECVEYSRKKGICVGSHITNWKKGEVRGNIYENPDLLTNPKT